MIICMTYTDGVKSSNVEQLATREVLDAGIDFIDSHARWRNKIAPSLDLKSAILYSSDDHCRKQPIGEWKQCNGKFEWIQISSAA